MDFFSRLKSGIDYIESNIRDLKHTVNQELFWTSELSSTEVQRIVTFVDGIHSIHDELDRFYNQIIEAPVTLDAAEQRLANIYKSVGVEPKDLTATIPAVNNITQSNTENDLSNANNYEPNMSVQTVHRGNNNNTTIGTTTKNGKFQSTDLKTPRVCSRFARNGIPSSSRAIRPHITPSYQSNAQPLQIQPQRIRNASSQRKMSTKTPVSAKTPAFTRPMAIEFTPGMTTNQHTKSNNSQAKGLANVQHIPQSIKVPNRQLFDDSDLPMNPVLKSVKKIAPKALSISNGTPEMPKLRANSRLQLRQEQNNR